MATKSPTSAPLPTEAALQAYRMGWHRSKHSKLDYDTALERYKEADENYWTRGWMDWAANNEGDKDWGSSLPIWRVVWPTKNGGERVSRRLTQAEAYEMVDGADIAEGVALPFVRRDEV